MFQDVQNNLIVVCSGTKGVGKTWLAAALAEALASKKEKVLFFDADAGAENVAFQRGLKKNVIYRDMIKGKITLNNAVCSYAKLKFDVIYANPLENVLNAYPAGRAQILALDLKNLSKLYGYVVADCSNDNVVIKNILQNAAGKIVLILGAGKNALSDAYRELENIKKICFEPEVGVVVNHALSRSEGEQIFATLESANNRFIGIKLKLLGVIDQDGCIRDCVLSKASLFERYPSSQSLKNVMSIAEAIYNKGEV